jgi:ankyrin repeat protein
MTAQRKDGSTLLHLASRWGHVKVACFLVEHGVDVTAINKHGWTALHLASRWGHVEASRLLLDHGADATALNKYGSTPLHLALQAGHVEVSRLLVEHGADTTGMDEQIATPLWRNPPRKGPISFNGQSYLQMAFYLALLSFFLAFFFTHVPMRYLSYYYV